MSVENQVLYLLSKVPYIEAKELIKIYEAQGYTAQSIRNILSKLKKEYYVSSTGRSVYSITKSGLELTQSIYGKENFYDHIWDHKWYMVLSDIPETLRKKRDTFRRSLVDLGFGQLYKSVYVYPWNLTREVISIIDKLEIEEHVTILTSNEFILNSIRHEGSNGTNQASTIWDLSDMNQMYKEKLVAYREHVEPHINDFIHSKSNDYLKLFICYLQVNDIKHELLKKDPMLPPEFLPQSWTGTHVLSTLTHAAERIKRLIPESSVYYPFL